VLANGTPKKPLETLLGGNYLMPAFDLLSRYEKLKPEWIKGVWKLQEKGAASELFLGTLGFNRALCDPGDIKTYARQIAALPPKVLTRMMDDYQHQSTLILSGEKDLVTPPETQDVLHQLMPNAELVRIRHGSHCSTLDLPEYVNLLIEKFLEQPPKIG
jgi:pimeloyl-ACP methyl ester carboxylesterase